MPLLNAYFEFSTNAKRDGHVALDVFLYDGKQYVASKTWIGDSSHALSHLGRAFWLARSAMYYQEDTLPGEQINPDGDVQLPLF